MELPASGGAMHGVAFAKVGGIHQARHARCHCSCVVSLRCKKSKSAPMRLPCHLSLSVLFVRAHAMEWCRVNHSLTVRFAGRLMATK